MDKINQNSVEIVRPVQQMDIEKNIQSFGKVPKVKNNALRKGTEKNNVLRNKIRIKSEIEATCDSPISCLNRFDLGYYSHRLSSI